MKSYKFLLLGISVLALLAIIPNQKSPKSVNALETTLKEEVIYAWDFENFEVGARQEKGAAASNNIYNAHFENLVIVGDENNKYLKASTSGSGSNAWPIFYFNQLWNLESEVSYRLSFDVISANYVEFYLGNNDGNDKPCATYSLTNYLGKTDSPYVLGGSFDGTHLTFDFVPNADYGEHWAQVAFIIKHSQKVEFAIDNVKITKTVKDAVYSFDFENYAVGTRQEINGSGFANMWNPHFKDLEIAGDENNQYLKASNTANGEAYSTFYFNQLGNLISGTKYRMSFDVLSAQYTELYLCYHDSGKPCVTYSVNEYLRQDADEFVLGGSFDGKHLTFDFIPSTTKGDYWAQVAIVIKYSQAVELAIDNVKIYELDYAGKEISVDTTNSNLTYYVGEAFDLSKLNLSMTRHNGQVRPLANNEYILDTTNVNMNVAGTYPVTAKVVDEYGNLLTTSFSITVKEDVVTGVALAKSLNKTVYLYGEALDLTGLEVVTTYESGKTVTLDNSNLTIEGYNAEQIGRQDIRVIYGDDTFTIAVEVIADSNATVIDAANITFDNIDLDTNTSSDAGKIYNTWNDSFDLLAIKGDSDNHYLKATKKTIGSDNWPLFYLNNLWGMKPGVAYRLEFDVLELNCIEFYIGYNGGNGAPNAAYSQNSYLYTSNDKVVLGGSFDGSHLTYDFIPSPNSVSNPDYWAQVAIILKHNSSDAVIAIDNVRVYEISATGKEIVKDETNMKTNYYVGEGLDLSGLTVSMTRQNGMVRVFNANECQFDTANVNMNEAGTYTVGANVSDEYGNLFTTSVEVIVKEDVLNTVELSEKPTKLSYYEGEELALEGLELTATYESGKVEVLEASDVLVSGYDKNLVDKQTITVSYAGKTVTFEVEVLADSVASIAVTANPTTVCYAKGQALVIDGLVVTATHQTGRTSTVDHSKLAVTGYDANVLGKQTITVNFEALTTSFEVEVIASVKDAILDVQTKAALAFDYKKTTSNLTGNVTYSDFTNVKVSLHYEFDASAYIDVEEIGLSYQLDDGEVILQAAEGNSLTLAIENITDYDQVINATVYVKATDGTYHYGKAISYSVKTMLEAYSAANNSDYKAVVDGFLASL